MVELIIENEQNKEEFTTEISSLIQTVCEKVMETEECEYVLFPLCFFRR